MKTIFFLLLLAACTVGPDYEQPKFFSNQELSASLDKQPDSLAYKFFTPQDFQDTTLNQLIELAEQNSPTISSALIKVIQSRYALKIQEVAGLPTLDARGQYDYVKNSKNLDRLLREDYYQVGADVSWELDLFGKNRRQTEMARAEVAMTLESLKSIYISLIAEVTNNYIAFRLNERLIQNAEDTLILQENIYNLAQKKVTAGLLALSQLKQIAALMESIRAQIPPLKANVEQYKNALSLLTGKLPGALDTLLSQNSKLINTPLEVDIARLFEFPVTVLQNRPDVRAAEQNLIAKNAAIGVAVANLFPNISLSAAFGFAAVPGKNILSKNGWTYSFNPVISQPLFHFGALKNAVKLAKADKTNALIQYEQILLTAAGEVKNAMVVLQSEIEANELLFKTFLSTLHAVQLTDKNFESGRIPFSEALTLQKQLFETQVDLIKSNAALYKDLILFYKAIGGGINNQK